MDVTHLNKLSIICLHKMCERHKGDSLRQQTCLSLGWQVWFSESVEKTNFFSPLQFLREGDLQQKNWHLNIIALMNIFFSLSYFMNNHLHTLFMLTPFAVLQCKPMCVCKAIPKTTTGQMFMKLYILSLPQFFLVFDKSVWLHHTYPLKKVEAALWQLLFCYMYYNSLKVLHLRL